MDATERQQALDCQQSFIVQAPAGSGKTELLTQRYLALLAKVADPQAILALTFTKKAAQEMRHRILQALQDAAQNLPLQSPHQANTRKLANQALKQDQIFGWSILAKPQQLCITTFDAFCLELYQNLPLQEAAKIANISNYPEQCYQQAIYQWFDWCRSLPELHAMLTLMLDQMDFKLNKLFGHLQELLKTRDQWLRPLSLQARMEPSLIDQGFAKVVRGYYQAFQQSIPHEIQLELIDISQKVAQIRPDLYPHLQQWQFADIQPPLLQELNKLLCTSTQEFRKEFNHHVGLKADSCPPEVLKALKKQSKELLSQLDNYSEFKHLLLHLPQFPDPNHLALNHALMQAYYHLLPLLVAHLHLEFAKQESCDFIYIAQYALVALQESDLKLHLEQQLQHLLVDEFQDTSEIQHELLKHLTLDFEQEPDKTVFMVGDPMQSIYRFRAAKVGIFLHVQQQGLGDLPLQTLQLSQNFRSAPLLIKQLNQIFTPIFPATEQIELGAVGFHPACPALPEHPSAALEALYCNDSQEQGQKIVELLELAMREQVKSVAILVRSRQQMRPIMQALAQAKIAYQGLDLSPLSEHWIIRDLLNLTKLLLKPGHRPDELAVLRGPLVGLDISDLHHLCTISVQGSVLASLSKPAVLDQLSSPAQARLQHFITILEHAKQQQFSLPFYQVLTNLCLHLQVQALFPLPEQALIIERFFSIITQICQEQAWPDIELITAYFAHSYWSCHQAFQLQLMTMHKSKGLEFDWVIIPNLGDGPRPISHQALMWMKTEAQQLFLVQDRDQVQNSYFYRYREQEQERYETLRLAYVAFTRARLRLYLLDDKIKAEKSSLRALFPSDFFQPSATTVAANHVMTVNQHQRLTLNDYLSKPITASTLFTQNTQFNDHYIAKQLGIITHKMVQWICSHHPHTLAQIPWKLAENLLFHARLPLHLCSNIQQTIQRFWHCPIGQWIRAPHAFEANEWGILVKDQAIMRQAMLDRTFVDQGIRWIIDFKTGQKEDKSHRSYQVQVNRYAHYLQTLDPHQPIHCGLYYLSTTTWDTWTSLEQNLFDFKHAIEPL